MRMRYLWTLVFCLGGVSAYGQAPVVTTTTRIDVDLPLAEGSGKVTGTTDSRKVMLRVYSGWQGVETPSDQPLDERLVRANNNNAIDWEPADRIDALACAASGQPVSTAGPIDVPESEVFEFQLRQPLNAGECVVVSDMNSDFRRAFFVPSVIMDFGRLRGYFSVGGSVAQSRSSFSTADTFIGITTDSRIIAKMIERDRSVAADVPGPLDLSAFRIQLNGIVDARVGVKFQTSGGENAAATGGQPTEASFQRPDHLAYSWDQPGYLQLGLHLPMSWRGMDWRSDGRLYSFFVGPIVKGGVQAFDSPVVVGRTVEIDLQKESTDTARYKTTFNDAREGALPFVVYGARLGIYAYDLLGQVRRNRQISNDPVSYVDVTWGKSSGYRSYTFDRLTNQDKTIETVTITSRRLRRLSIEGRLKIPSVPALIGFDVNLRAPGTDETPNDFRFIAAFRVDAQRALAQVFGAKVTSGR